MSRIHHTFHAQAGEDSVCTCGKPKAYHPTEEELRAAEAEDILNAQPLETLEQAKAFAKAWILTASQHARNEAHYRSAAEHATGAERERIARIVDRWMGFSHIALAAFIRRGDDIDAEDRTVRAAERRQ
jgi:hypothetical protein